MTITFNKADRDLIAEKLEHEDIRSSKQRIDRVLHNVALALAQQFDEEADYMVNQLEVS